MKILKSLEEARGMDSMRQIKEVKEEETPHGVGG
jgi:hypothetical protein